MRSFMRELLLIPNLLSLLRLLLSVVIPFLWVKKVSPKVIYSLLVMGVVSDTLDGNLARLLRQKTRLGKILDPLADKFFINMLFFLFYYEDKISSQLFFTILLRDVLILLGVLILLYFSQGRLIPSPSILGKATTVIQLLGLLALFADQYLLSLPNYILNLILNLIFFLTLASGFYYLLNFRRLLLEFRQGV